MAINRVPKFVEHQIAKRRREHKTGTAPVKSGKKFSAFDAARKKYEHKQSEAEQALARKAEAEQKQKEHKKERKQIGKLVNKRNNRGQPDMNSQLELLMKRYKS